MFFSVAEKGEEQISGTFIVVESLHSGVRHAINVKVSFGGREVPTQNAYRNLAFFFLVIKWQSDFRSSHKKTL